jgi:hypothetical protein
MSALKFKVIGYNLLIKTKLNKISPIKKKKETFLEVKLRD